MELFPHTLKQGDRELFDNQRCRLDSAPCPVNLTEDNPQPSNVIVKDVRTHFTQLSSEHAQ